MSAGYLGKCGRKRRHETQEEAEKQRQRMISSGAWQARTSNTYPCNVCGGYHAGRVGWANRGKNRTTAKNRPRHLDTQ